MRVVLLCILVSWIVSFNFNACEAVVIDKIVAVVNGEPITLSEVRERMELLRKTGIVKHPDFKKVLHELILEKLQLQSASKLGIEVGDEDIKEYLKNFMKENGMDEESFKSFLKSWGLTLKEYKEEVRRRMILSRLLHYEVSGKVAVSPEEIEEYYNKHKAEYKLPDIAHVFLIFIPLDREKEALDIFRKLKNDPLLFKDMAREFSLGPASDRGGDLGYVERGQLIEEIDKKIFDERETLFLVKRPEGYYIVWVKDRKMNRYKSLDSVRDEIHKKLYDRKAKKLYNKWLDELYKNSNIKVLADA